METGDVVLVVIGVMLYIAGACISHEIAKNKGFAGMKAILLAVCWPGILVAMFIAACFA